MGRQLHDTPRPRQYLIERSEERGYTPESLAAAMGVSLKTVERMFRGETKLRRGQRPLLAELLDIPYRTLTAELNGDRTPVLEDGWWSNFSTMEQSAISIRSYQPVLVPGLLQTRAYASALLASADLVARRLERQQLVARIDDPIPMTAILDESILHRPIGGTEAFADQLAHLAAMATRPNVTIRVLPFDAPEQPAHWGALAILRFPWRGGLVYLEHTDGAQSLDSAHDVAVHEETFDALTALTLPEDASLTLIRNAIKEHKP